MPQSFNTELIRVAANYIKLLKVNVTESSLQKDLEENSDYPSLLSLSDTFSKYNIKNNAYEVASKNFTRLETPFISFMNLPNIGKDFVLITSITEKTVDYLHKNNKSKTLAKEEFLKQYQNIVWTAEPDEYSGERNFEEKFKAEKKIKRNKKIWLAATIILILCITTANFPVTNVLAFCSIALLKLVGLATTILLLIYETDKSNSFVKNVCSVSQQTNCDAILNGKGSKIFGISWAEIGFFYFASTLLWLLLPGFYFINKITCLSTVTILASPYIFFSIYYQWQVVKQWCPLCLTIQLVLFTELLWSIILYRQYPFSLFANFSLFFAMLFCILLPIVLWYGLKSAFIKAKDYRLYITAYKRLQYNPKIFNSLLKQQQKAPEGWQQLGITIGNPNATISVIKVCNPYCGPCARAHSHLEELVKSNDVSIKIIFTAKNNKDEKGAIVAKHLLAIAEKENIVHTRKALDDWYLADKKDYDFFSEKHKMNGEIKLQELKIDAMSRWCDEAEITYTPTLFVNGYRLPENYKIEELKHIFSKF